MVQYTFLSQIYGKKKVEAASQLGNQRLAQQHALLILTIR